MKTVKIVIFSELWSINVNLLNFLLIVTVKGIGEWSQSIIIKLSGISQHALILGVSPTSDI